MNRPAILAALAAATVNAVTVASTRTYPVFPRQEDIVIDGRLDEPAWQQAAVGTDFFALTPGVTVQRTEFRMLHDPKALYLGMELRESAMDAQVLEKSDSQRVFLDDSVEIFLKTDPAGKGYWRNAYNAKGLSLHPGTEVSARRGQDRYTLEIRIPFAALADPPRPGQKLTGNICRNTRTTNPVVHSSWARLRRSFHEPQNFAQFQLQSEPVSQKQLKNINTLVNVACDGNVISAARARVDAYSRLSNLAEQSEPPTDDAQKIVAGWKAHAENARRYLAYVSYVQHHGSARDFWYRDHKVVDTGPCPPATAMLRDVSLTVPERDVRDHYRLIELLQ